MPKKGGKRLADIDQGAGEGSAEGDAAATDNATPAAAAVSDAPAADSAPATATKEDKPAPETPTPVAKAEVSSNAIEPKTVPAKVAEQPKPQAQPTSQPEHPPVPPGPALSARQRQAGAAWEQYQRGVDKQYMNVFQNVERDVGAVCKSLQAMQAGAAETHKSVKTAKAYLSDIAQALEAVDTLVVPIVLQRDGTF